MHSEVLKNTFFYLLLVVTTIAFIWLLNDFIMPLFWAATFSVLFYPLFRRLRERLRDRAALASLLTILIILFIVILPSFLVGLAVSNQLTSLYEQHLSDGVTIQEVYRYIEENLPGATEYLEEYGIDLEKIEESFSGAFISGTQFLATKAYGLGGNVLRFLIMLFIMIYLLFFFLRDGEQIIKTLIRVLPIGDERERLLFSKFTEVLQATVKGTFVVGIIQGTMGGLLFWFLGIDAAILWGVLMILFSILPAVGSPVVWFPASIILIVTGSWIKGVIMILVGTLIIGLVDNFLRPILVGRATRMPDYLILLSTLGGLTLFGISGFIIGPVIASLFLTVWQIFMQDYSVQE